MSRSTRVSNGARAISMRQPVSSRHDRPSSDRRTCEALPPAVMLRTEEPDTTIGRMLREWAATGVTTLTSTVGCTIGPPTAVSLGGDGTFLRTAVWVGDKGIPIIGVNTGHLGFLTTLPVERLCELLSALQNDSLRLERRHMLSVRSCLPDSRMVPYALNEVAVAKVETASMIEARVEIDGLHMADYRADGIIVATATGSTAYIDYR